jgi:hypothetical protein
MFKSDMMKKIVNKDDKFSLERYNQNIRVSNSVRTLETRTKSWVRGTDSNANAKGQTANFKETNDNFDFPELVLHFMGWGEANVCGKNDEIRKVVGKDVGPVGGKDLFPWAILT